MSHRSYAEIDQIVRVLYFLHFTASVLFGKRDGPLDLSNVSVFCYIILQNLWKKGAKTQKTLQNYLFIVQF